MSSGQPKQRPGKPVAPFQRPGLTYINHINDLIRGPLFSQNNLKKTASTMSSPDSTRSDASSGSPYRPRSPRPLPTLAEADERRRRLCEEMERMWPSEPLRAPDFGGPSDPMPETLQAQGIQGFDRELEDIIVAKHEKTMRYKEFHLEWTDLQKKLLKVSKELRAEYDGLIEEIESVHHKHIRHRITKTEYTSARQPLTDQMDILFERLGKIVFTLGTMYAVSRAVAQGANPTGDFDFGKLKIAACAAVPYLNHHFPEFARKKPSTLLPDPMGPRPRDIAFKDGLPTFDFNKMMAEVWAKHPTKLKDVHHAVFEEDFVGIKPLTQMEKDNANALLGNGGTWSM